MRIDKTVVVKKQTRLEELLKRYVTNSQIKFYLEVKGESFDYFKEEHDAYRTNLDSVTEIISRASRMQVVDKYDLPTYQFGESDLVVVVGDDGLVVNASKYVGEQPLIAVNADEQRYDGVLATCSASRFQQIYEKTLEGKFNVEDVEELTMAQAKLDDGQIMYGLNDLFIGRNTHVSARYSVRFKGKEEKQSSSGIIASTGTGSTGWMTSVMREAAALTGMAPKLNVPYNRDEKYLIFVVREPFPSKATGTSIVYGIVAKENPLTIISHMPENGVIFGDGIEKDYLDFIVGRTAVITPADKKVQLIRDSNYK